MASIIKRRNNWYARVKWYPPGAKWQKIKEIPYVLVENHTFSQYHNKFNLVNEFLNKNNFVIVKRFYYPTFHYKDVLYKKKGQ